MKPRPRAYSYVRFSTPEQMKGDSLRRQTEAAVRYAALHGLDLDESLTFRDLGVSAFRGANIGPTGALGDFLSLVHYGDIPPGSFLLVENLDRISRSNILEAQHTINGLIIAGITIVTLMNGSVYSRERMEREPYAAFEIALGFIRANDESATKAKRLREAWGAKRRRAMETGEPLSALCPGWMKLSDDRSAYELIPARAAVVRDIFQWSLEGAGQHSITTKLNAAEVPVFGRGKQWHRSYIKKILVNPSTYGEFTPHEITHVNGKRVRVPTEAVADYFPAVIDEEIFRAVQVSRATPTAARRGTTKNILAGLAKCPKCGMAMTRVTKGSRKRAGRPFLVCSKAKTGAGCEYVSVRHEYVETALLNGASELIGLMPSPSDELQRKWEAVQVQVDVLEDTIRNMLETLEEAPLSKALAARLTETERVLAETEEQRDAIEEQIFKTFTNRVLETAEGEFLGAIETGEVPAINNVMRQLFEAVVVNYQTGNLELHWKHAPDIFSTVMFAWPRE